MLLPRQTFYVLLVVAGLLVLGLAVHKSTCVPAKKEGLTGDSPSASTKSGCPGSAAVLPFQNAGNVAALQTQMSALLNSSTKAVAGYETLETTTTSLGTRLSKVEEELEKLQASIKQNAQVQNDKVKKAQAKLNQFQIK